MATMTWKEFKEEVDRQLREMGVTEDVPVVYIDVRFPSDTNSIEVGVNGGFMAIE